MDSPKRLARAAGVFYLIVAILGGFAQVVRLDVFAPGDAATTVANVVANASLVRMSFVADLTQATFLLLVVMSLYRLLRHVNKSVAHAMVIFVVVAVAVICLNMLHQLGGLLVATDPSYAGAFGPEGSPALVLLLFDLQHSGYLIAQIFFGLWLFPLGLLVYRSGMFPRPLGVTLMVATGFYLLDVALQFLAPELAGVVNPLVVVVATVSEVSMLAYLLIKGVKTRPADHALAT
ncbi:hypothetical protein Aple_033770 [Acrocarpospora pleiomorpha]|uniref:DUF4386 domain-containing protein n=1 Tax=Acrocarpospora pleiomorpha TaxID=90975 RepID=A0A5M3XLF3_9ACTN|nr:DUF4386 domain-containing protein [Acrocarpospora pleiomorpha]GES20481.1 hypothetical protein Aple_033770 [Acrocarpospora pleiomorpha]